ncbi:hypothetical protein WMO40_23140 [Bacillaceae bacterium CLA-AA-H227]|uniref:Uncharacterized protein n=1 Tax=Robertmurraya yapensis (ex Hitch et al 2024) TaxID=3133160 RepID=A0ACC6SHM2_9BACI
MKDRLILGYMLLACKQLNYTKEEARDLIGELLILLETKTDEEIEEGFQWYMEYKMEVKPTKTGIKPKNPRKITSFPEGYRSKLSIENEKLIKLLRSISNP